MARAIGARSGHGKGTPAVRENGIKFRLLSSKHDGHREHDRDAQGGRDDDRAAAPWSVQGPTRGAREG
jgi:hypothetical protein